MKLKRAIPYAALLWAFIFIAISIILMISMNNFLFNTLHFLLIPILTLLVAKLYFKNAKAGWKEGFKLALIFLIVGTILDWIFTTPLFIGSHSRFYTWGLWFGLFEMALFAFLAGKFFEDKSKEPKKKKKRKK